jgi:enoyl-CoA hydratase/carnithine racemase
MPTTRKVDTEMLDRSHRDSTAWLKLDRPERLNAFTGADYRDLAIAVNEAAADPATRALVLTGKGRTFSAGADRSLVDGTASPESRSDAGIQFHAMLDAFDHCDKPIFAAVNGPAVGIGCTILLHCDLVLLAESARLRFPFTALGIVPEAGSSVLLPARASWGDSPASTRTRWRRPSGF